MKSAGRRVDPIEIALGIQSPHGPVTLLGTRRHYSARYLQNQPRSDKV